jgi:phosphatidylserine/phosphatidylglycerophosphate/cardiolipin synthase-like enzyme
MGKGKSKTSQPRAQSRRHLRLWRLLSGLALLLAAAYVIQGDVLTPQPGSTPQPAATQGAVLGGSAGDTAATNSAVEVFFTTPSLVYPDVPEQRTPPPHEQALIADIDAAQQSIDAAFYEYNLLSLARALVRAQERGVSVRLALDRENLEEPEEAHWAGQVQQAGIPIAWQETTAFQHSKFLIIDEAIVWTGSWNASENGTYRNNNNLLRLTIPAIAENYAAEFGQMLEGRFGSQKASITLHPVVMVDSMLIETYFSPNDGIEQHIVERLNNAQHSIDFMAFSFTSDPIAEVMIARHQADVQVRGIFENRNASGTGSEFDRLDAQEGIDVLKDGNCYTMHHKVLIIDDATVVTGSYNFTARAEDTNDENLLIIDSPEMAAQYLAEFERVYEQAHNPTRCGR